VLEYEPDRVVVYVGNNGFYVAYVVASLHRAAWSTAVIRLVRAARSLAIAQTMDAVIGRYATRDAATMMEAMVGRSSIGPGDPVRAVAARHLKVFIGDMIDRCERRGVPVIVCTPPANERDLAPLGTADVSGLDASVRGALEARLLEAGGPDAAGAEAAARAAIALHPEHATAHHLLGRALEAQGEIAEAGAAYRAAVDLDPMPWRPPAACVSAIREAVAEGGAVLCDLEGAFREESPVGSTGHELMDDHVHPSLRGQALVARSVARAMTELPGPVSVDAAALARLPEWEAYARRLGANPWDAYAAAHAMRLLGSIGFFRETNPEFLARHEAECARIESEAPPLVVSQLRAWTASAQGAEPPPITGLVGRALLSLGRAEEAEHAFRMAARSVAPYGLWDIQFTYLALAARGGPPDEAGRAEAGAAIERGRVLVESGGARSGLAEMFIGGLHQLRGEYAESIGPLAAAIPRLEGENRVAADEWLVRAYAATGRAGEARAVIDAGLRGPAAERYRAMAALLEPGAGGR